MTILYASEIDKHHRLSQQKISFGKKNDFSKKVLESPWIYSPSILFFPRAFSTTILYAFLILQSYGILKVIMQRLADRKMQEHHFEMIELCLIPYCSSDRNCVLIWEQKIKGQKKDQRKATERSGPSRNPRILRCFPLRLDSDKDADLGFFTSVRSAWLDARGGEMEQRAEVFVDVCVCAWVHAFKYLLYE